MKKPEKKTEKDFPEGDWQTICDNKTYIRIACDNYNDAITDYEAYIKERFSVEEIEKVLKEWGKGNNAIPTMFNFRHKLAKAINRLTREEK